VAQDLVDRGLAYQAHASGDLREAIRCYERAIGLDPSLAKPHYQLVAALAALGQAHDAASIYERRLVKAPDHVVAHRCLAQAQIAAGLWDDAARTIERGLALARTTFLLEWCCERGYDDDMEWPAQELARLRSEPGP
jgi:tetratricopeptide (TPR) repeat protein